jgi:predicted alpha/beta superfamily hydrolase
MKFKLFLIALFFYSIGDCQLPTVVAGTIQRIDSFKSKYVTARNIDIWLPEGYDNQKKYPVLYMHDGQMLFDSAITWNKASWDVDDVVTNLRKQNKISPVIVVGIWNGGATRHADYFPQKPFESLSTPQKKMIYDAARSNGYSVFGNYEIQSDNYLKFIVKELKPYIDSAYATAKDFKNTFIGGSSMGGLISMYAICEYPTVFGAAICMSTHWPGIFSMQDNPIPAAFNGYMEKHLPSAQNHKIYFDFGTKTLDSLYEPLQKQIDQTMRNKGYTKAHWETLKFEGDEHAEFAWRRRLHIPLSFIFKRKQ